MTKEELLKLHDTITAECKQILDSKGNDYSGDKDRLRNFKAVEIVKVNPVQGIMVRMIDKMTRMSELLEHDSKVKAESIEDTALDLFNYAFLLIAVLQDKPVEVLPALPQEVLDVVNMLNLKQETNDGH